MIPVMEEVVPLPLVYSALIISAIGVVGNLTIVLITVRNKTFHSRCGVLIAIAAFFDFVVCIHLVHLRILMAFKVYFISTSSCFYQSAYGIFAMNMQSAMGLFIGIDRFYNVSHPIRYFQVPISYYYSMFGICGIVAFLVTTVRFFVPSEEQRVPVCLPVTAVNGTSLKVWLGSNFVIALLVLFVYTVAYIKCQILKGRSVHVNTMEAINRVLKSLTIIVVIYSCTWFTAIFALFISDILSVSNETVLVVNRWAGFLVVCNSSIHVFVYFVRTPEYRKAILMFYGFHSISDSTLNTASPFQKKSVVVTM